VARKLVLLQRSSMLGLSMTLNASTARVMNTGSTAASST
jgi:preprotein translocase subunit SecG